jgi:hypothetical protein
MNKCLLCKTRDADKKGSHIVPHFLLKRIENIDDKQGRDYELAFAIGEFDTEAYFGRAVSPEKLEDTFGKLSDEEIDSNRHPLVVDFYFCAYCEERLSKIESEYAGTLATYNLQSTYESGITAELGFLFWGSIIWRMSIHQHSGTYLSDTENEMLRNLLDTFLASKISEIDQVKVKQDKIGKGISYRLLRSPKFSENNITYMAWHPAFRKVNSLIIDEFILSFSLTDSYDEYDSIDFLGANADILGSTKNAGGTNENIGPLSQEKMMSVNQSLVKATATQRRDRLSEFWDTVHTELGGTGQMPSYIKNEILDELSSEEKKMGRKHNQNEIQSSTFKVLLKYEFLYRPFSK